MNHVVVEAEIRPGRFVLFDPQNNPELNSYFDDQELSAEELILKPGSPFTRYSNLNLRRVPIVSSIVLHVKTEEGWVTRTLESPWMLKCLIGLGLSGLMLTVAVVDRLLVRIYAQRLGVSFSSEGCRLQSEETTKPSGGMIESCVI